MTIAFDSTSSGAQGIFNRLSRMFHLLNLINSARGGTSAGDWPVEVEDIIEYYDGDDVIQRRSVDDLIQALDTADGGLGAFTTSLRAAAEETLIEMTDADNPLVSRTVLEAEKELIQQMDDNSKTVDANEPSASVSMGGSNTGDGKVVVSVLSGKGETLEHILPEDIVGIVTSTGTAGAEVFTFKGETSQADRLAADWPKGSGTSQRITSRAVGSSVDLLTDGAFENFTSDDPDSWTIDTGLATDQVREETSTVYTGSASIRFLGDGSTQTAISQSLTVADLDSRTPYAFVAWLRRGGSAVTAGVLTVDLYDGSSTINDDEGTANSFTIDLTALTTSFVASEGVFRLPEPVPSAVTIRLRCTTAISNGHDVYVDNATLIPMTRIGSNVGGPYVSVHGGATNWALDDKATVTVTNDQRGAIQTMFGRFFPTMVQNDLFLPSATGGGENIDDSLVTT